MNFLKTFLLAIVCMQAAEISAADESNLSNKIDRIGLSEFFGRSFETEEEVIKALRCGDLKGHEQKGEDRIPYVYVFGLNGLVYAYKTRKDLVKAAKSYKEAGYESIQQKIIEAEARNRSCCVVS